MCHNHNTNILKKDKYPLMESYMYLILNLKEIGGMQKYNYLILVKS